jgi:hypothetical protein
LAAELLRVRDALQPMSKDRSSAAQFQATEVRISSCLDKGGDLLQAAGGGPASSEASQRRGTDVAFGDHLHRHVGRTSDVMT